MKKEKANPKTVVKRTVASTVEVTREQMEFVAHNGAQFDAIVMPLIKDLRQDVEVVGGVSKDGRPTMTVSVTVNESEAAAKDLAIALDLAPRLVVTILDTIDEVRTRIETFRVEFDSEYKDNSVEDVILHGQ